MSENKKILIIGDLTVFAGKVSDNFEFKKYMYGYFGGKYNCNEKNPNDTHSYVMGGLDLNSGERFICECGEAFMSSNLAKEHFEKNSRSKEENQYVQGHSSPEEVQTNEMEETSTDELTTAYTSTHALEIMEWIFANHGAHQDEFYLDTCAAFLGLKRSTITACKSNAQNRRVGESTSNDKDFSEQIQIKAKELHEKVLQCINNALDKTVPANIRHV